MTHRKSNRELSRKACRPVIRVTSGSLFSSAISNVLQPHDEMSALSRFAAGVGRTSKRSLVHDAGSVSTAERACKSMAVRGRVQRSADRAPSARRVAAAEQHGVRRKQMDRRSSGRSPPWGITAGSWTGDRNPRYTNTSGCRGLAPQSGIGCFHRPSVLTGFRNSRVGLCCHCRHIVRLFGPSDIGQARSDMQADWFPRYHPRQSRRRRGTRHWSGSCNCHGRVMGRRPILHWRALGLCQTCKACSRARHSWSNSPPSLCGTGRAKRDRPLSSQSHQRRLSCCLWLRCPPLPRLGHWSPRLPLYRLSGWQSQCFLQTPELPLH